MLPWHFVYKRNVHIQVCAIWVQSGCNPVIMCPHLFADGHPQGTAHSVQNEVMSGHVFQTKAALQAAIRSWCSNEQAALATYGSINDWDVTAVTDFDHLFMESVAENFNSDISRWDTSRVTTFKGLLDEALAFNQDITGWDTSSVTDMSQAFQSAHSFNQDVRSL